MKKRYEKSKLVIGISVLLIYFILLFGFYLFNKKIFVYKKFSGVVCKNNAIELLVSKEELKLFYKNTNIFINNKREKIKIVKVEKNILQREGVKYNHIFINVRLSGMYKVNDVVYLSILERKDRVINIFKIIWKGD